MPRGNVWWPKRSTPSMRPRSWGEAEAQAAKILAEASCLKAQHVEKNAIIEISLLAGKQALSKIKSRDAHDYRQEQSLLAVKAANLDPEFVKAMLLSVARNWNGASSSKVELQALLPEAERAKFDAAFAAAARSCSKRASKWVIRRRYAPASRWAPRAAAITSPSRTTISRHC